MSVENLKLPMISLGKYSISRLIAGGNPPHGGSHQTKLMNMHMREYFTLENMVNFLHCCKEQGINTWQSSYSQLVWDSLTQFRKEGGEMNFICLCSPDNITNKEVLTKVLDVGAIGIAFHGEVTDQIWRQGKIDSALETLEKIRNSGVLVGLSTHNPEVIEYTESKKWDLDFYMACVYRKSRDHAELMEIMKEVPIGEIYLPSDMPKMCQTIRSTQKPCLAFKILAAGRTCDSSDQVRKAFEFVFSHIKPKDAVIVGMYPRYTDQIKENADFTRAFGQI